MLQRDAFKKLYHQESVAILLANVMNGADIGMVQSGRRLRFPLESSQRVGIARQLFRKEFQGNEAMQTRVFGLVDHAHSTATESLVDTVVRNRLTNELVGIRHSAAILGCVLRLSQRIEVTWRQALGHSILFLTAIDAPAR